MMDMVPDLDCIQMVSKSNRFDLDEKNGENSQYKDFFRFGWYPNQFLSIWIPSKSKKPDLDTIWMALGIRDEEAREDWKGRRRNSRRGRGR